MYQKMNVTLRSKIGAEILILAKTFQAGRAPSIRLFVVALEHFVGLRNLAGAPVQVFGHFVTSVVGFYFWLRGFVTM